MSEPERPKGQYYHEVYLPPMPVENDRTSFRVRYAFLIDSFNHHDLWKFVVGETVIEAFKRDQHVAPTYRTAIVALAMPELLKVIHAVFLYCMSQARGEVRNFWTNRAREYIQDVQRLLVTERMNWAMDEFGGLHPLRDTVYAAEREAVISGLGQQRFANARAEFEKFIDDYDNGPPDNKAAIQQIFQTAEALFKLRFEPTPPARLADGEVRDYLLPQFPKPKSQHEPGRYAKTASHAMVEAFREWVLAAQQYRHEQGTPDVVEQPPDDTTQVIVTTGMAFIRSLIKIDPGS